MFFFYLNQRHGIKHSFAKVSLLIGTVSKVSDVAHGPLENTRNQVPLPLPCSYGFINQISSGFPWFQIKEEGVFVDNKLSPMCINAKIYSLAKVLSKKTVLKFLFRTTLLSKLHITSFRRCSEYLSFVKLQVCSSLGPGPHSKFL